MWLSAFGNSGEGLQKASRVLSGCKVVFLPLSRHIVALLIKMSKIYLFWVWVHMCQSHMWRSESVLVLYHVWAQWIKLSPSVLAASALTHWFIVQACNWSFHLWCYARGNTPSWYNLQHFQFYSTVFFQDKRSVSFLTIFENWRIL